MATRAQHTAAYRRLTALLRRVREEAGLTQRELATLLRKHHTLIHRSETGDRRIDPMEFIAWCRACEVDPASAIRELESRR